MDSIKLTSELLSSFNVGEHADLIRYVFATINLERKLARRPALSRELGAALASIDERRRLQHDTDSTLDD